MASNPLGPFFRCYPDKFAGGFVGLNDSQIAFYTVLIFRMYDAGDAVPLDYKTIGSWCGSNARKAKRIIDSLIEKGKLHKVDGEHIIDLKALREMLKNCADAKKSSRHIPNSVVARLTKLSLMFDDTFAKELRNLSEKGNKNKGPYNRAEVRGYNSDQKNIKKGVLVGLPTDGTAEEALFQAVTSIYKFDTWAAWFTDSHIQIIDGVIHPFKPLTKNKIENTYYRALQATGLTLGDVRTERKTA